VGIGGIAFRGPDFRNRTAPPFPRSAMLAPTRV
jgi:hypothetical protein